MLMVNTNQSSKASLCNLTYRESHVKALFSQIAFIFFIFRKLKDKLIRLTPPVAIAAAIWRLDLRGSSNCH